MSEGKRYAILIAASQFPQEPALPPLRCPESDVDGLDEVLCSPEMGSFDDTFVVKNTASYEALVKINEVLREAKREDQVLVYYSGHGKTDDAGRLYLTTANTRLALLESTSIAVENLRTYIVNSNCRKVILILDCCYSGAVGKTFVNVKSSVDEQLKQMPRGRGIYILTSSTSLQTSQERPGDKYSLLTKHILTGIREGEADANEDGKISVEELYDYVRRRVVEEGSHEPMRWAIDVRGEELIIARSNRSPRREKQRLLRQRVLEIIDYLPPKMLTSALLAIEEGESDYYALLDQLYRKRLSIGEFIEEWYDFWWKERLVTVESGSAKSVRQRPISPNSFADDVNGIKLEMVYVPTGRFKMGSPMGKGYDPEWPQHDVTLSSFYIGKFQITQTQWEAVMGHPPSHFKGGDLPVECVSWDDAQAFCQKLTQKTQKAYRLPSEAEWEYACRAGMTDDYPEELDLIAWYSANSDGKTHIVGQKQPNAFGLYDMCGNIWEWCRDEWQDSYIGAPADGSAWESGSGESRVVRGGSWLLDGVYCRPAFRHKYPSSRRLNLIGFRLAVSANIT